MIIGYLDDNIDTLISEIMDNFEGENEEVLYKEITFENTISNNDDLGILSIAELQLDLLILDINLFKQHTRGPRVNGLELATLYKNVNPNMDIIFITSDSDHLNDYANQFEIIKKPSTDLEKKLVVEKLYKYKLIYDFRIKSLKKYNLSDKSQATKTILDRIEGNAFSLLTDDKIDEIISMVEEIKKDGL